MFFGATLERQLTTGNKKKTKQGRKKEEDDATLQQDELGPSLKFSWQPCPPST